MPLPDEIKFQQIDHILYGGPDLDLATQQVVDTIGVIPMKGGSHPDKGTRNRLLGLSHGAYLEVIGTDPAQEVDQVWMNIDQFSKPRLFRWAAKCNDLESLRERALFNGIDLGAIHYGHRKKPDGTLLEWRLTDPSVVLGDGLVPFFIDWGEDGNPSNTLPYAGEILDFYGVHPNPEPIRKMLDVLEIEFEIIKETPVELYARFSAPNGIVELS